MTRKKVNFDAVCFPLVFLEREKKIFCSVNAKNISSQMLNISEFYSYCALVNLLIFSSQLIKYFWYSPQNSKYPLFPNLLEVVNYRVLISHQPLIPVQNLSWLSVGLKYDR